MSANALTAVPASRAKARAFSMSPGFAVAKSAEIQAPASRIVQRGPEYGPGRLPLPRPEGCTLAGQEPYGQAVARLFGVETAATMTTASLTKAQLAVTRLTAQRPGIGLTTPLPAEHACLLILHLSPGTGNRLWKAGRRVEHQPFAAGSIVIADLADEPCIDVQDPLDCLLMHIPRIVFDELADAHGTPQIDALQDQTGTADPVVHDLARALLPSLALPGQVSQSFFDHVAFAIYARLADRYGRRSPRPARSGAGFLSAPLERLAKEALSSDLTQPPSLALIARACDMPVNRFVRAFRQTTGLPPFRWLRAFRVERAKDLLLNSRLSLAQIAYDCGFADQSHFTRVFFAAMDTTPGAWRSHRR